MALNLTFSDYSDVIVQTSNLDENETKKTLGENFFYLPLKKKNTPDS